jgi:hypothetical protein
MMKNIAAVLTLVFLFLFIGNFIKGDKLMAQETSNEELQKRIDYLKKQTELMEAEKAMIEAQKALDKAKEPLTPAEKEIQNKLAAAKAEKDLVEAQKALSDAELAAFKASLGEVPQPPHSGSVDLKDKGSELPVSLLAAQAIKKAAIQIANKLNDIKKKGTLLVLASSEIPTFQNLVTYKAQLAMADNALQTALDESFKLGLGTRKEAVPILGAAGFTLDAINKLLGFFRTDYTVGGVEVALDDSMLVLETASRLCGPNTGWGVKLPAVYNPKAILDSGKKIIKNLTDLSIKKIQALSRMKLHEDYIAELNNEAKKVKDQAEKDKIERENEPLINRHKEVGEKLKQAAAIYDLLFSKITAFDEKANLVPLSAIAREYAFFEALSQLDEAGNPTAYLLILHIHKGGGGYLIKNNLWTFFGGMPLYYLGGTVVSYALLQGPDGSLCKSGLIPIYGGYTKANKMQEALKD